MSDLQYAPEAEGVPGAAAAETERARVEKLAAELENVVLSRAASGATPFLVAIDGRCGSGKTTLAASLSVRRGWGVAHMDEFFLRPEQRTPERYAEPGGNFDRERFLSEVLKPLRAGDAVRYRPFDCAAMQLREPVFLKPSPVVLLEGSYSCHPLLWGFYDFRVFLTVRPETQAARILRRNGPEKAEIFKTRWIPMEERYFRAFSVPERCDCVLHTD